jgi:anti-sigma regulatory factor (Ser/Thr protein kinase)
VDQLSESAAVVTSELVGNAVKHARTELHVTAFRRRDRLLIAVFDRSTARPVLIYPPDGLGEASLSHGRGLYLVDVYSTAWGINPPTTVRAYGRPCGSHRYANDC